MSAESEIGLIGESRSVELGIGSFGKSMFTEFGNG